MCFPSPTRSAAASLLSAWALCALLGGSAAADDAARPKSDPATQPELELVLSTREKKPEDPHKEELPENTDYLALADTPVFLPRSYLYWGSPTGPKHHRQPLIFALEYALHLPAYNDLRDKALLGKAWAGAATLSFEGDLRMLAEESKPVRMPSYRPVISGQLFYLWYRPAPVLFGLRSGLYHYSNGQERCTFDIALSDESAACQAITERVLDPSRTLNRVSGNFGTNGYLLELHARIHRLNTLGVAVAHLAAGFDMMGNFRAGWGLEPGLREFYGWGRLRGSLEARHLIGKSALTLRTSMAGYPDTGRRTPSVDGLIEMVVAPYWLTGFGFFVRYYGGRDFYNAFFVDAIQQFAAGIAWDGERPLKFRLPTPEASERRSAPTGARAKEGAN